MDPILILNPDRTIKDLNEATEQIFGVGRADLVGKDIVRFFDDPNLASESISIVLDQGCASDLRLAMRSEGGRIIDISVNASVYRSGDGEPEAVIMFLRDISEQLRRDYELRHLASIVEHSNDAIFSLSVHGVIKSWNRGAEQTYGYKKEEMIGNHVSHLQMRGAHDELTDILNRMRKGETTRDHYEMQHKRKDDSTVHMAVMLSAIKDSSGHVIGASAISRDVSREKLLTAALMKERNSITSANEILSKQAVRLSRQAHQLGLLAEMGGLLQVCETDDEVYFVLSQFAEQLFPASSGALFVPGDDRSVVERVVAWGPRTPTNESFATSDCLGSHRAQPHISSSPRGTEFCKHLDGITTDHSFLCAPITLRGELLGVVIIEWADREVVPEDEALTIRVLGDVSLALSNLRLRQKLREMALRDPLTGLFNRRYMEEFFAGELLRSRRQERSLSILVFDIDHFKRFNDNFGHEAGDTVLRTLGAFLRKHVRGSDVICRWGGEEVVILLPETPLETANSRAEIIRKTVGELPILHLEKPLPNITLSIGVASFPEHGDDFATIFRAADGALYVAKEQGRNRVVISDKRVPVIELPVMS